MNRVTRGLLVGALLGALLEATAGWAAPGQVILEGARTHLRRVSAGQPIFAAIELIAAHGDGYSDWCSCTIRTVRSRLSLEYGCAFSMTPISQRRESPATPGRFSPQGQTSSSWSERVDRWNNPIISVKFSRTDGRLCVHQALCTKAKTAPRHMTLRPQEEHEKRQAIRQQQSTPEWKEQYNKRVGIEGTLSQAVRVFEVRKTRYIGLAKTRLQHILTASAINIIRMMNWLGGIPHVETQPAHFAALAPQRA